MFAEWSGVQRQQQLYVCLYSRLFVLWYLMAVGKITFCILFDNKIHPVTKDKKFAHSMQMFFCFFFAKQFCQILTFDVKRPKNWFVLNIE